MSLHLLIFVFAIIPSTFLLNLIAKYHKEKPPGLQTILDLMFIDSVNLFHTFNASTTLVFFIENLAKFYGKVSFPIAQLGYFLFDNCVALFFASLQVSQMVKGILIFKAELLEHNLDEEVLKYSRIGILAYGLCRFLFDLSIPPESNALTQALTGSDVELFNADGTGKKILAVILLLTFITLKIKSPKLPTDNEGNWYQKCFANWFGEIFCVVISCFMVFGVYTFGPDMWILRFLFHFILRVLFPFLYIYNLPALYQYVLNVFKELNHQISEYFTQALNNWKRSPQIDVIE